MAVDNLLLLLSGVAIDRRAGWVRGKKNVRKLEEKWSCFFYEKTYSFFYRDSVNLIGSFDFALHTCDLIRCEL